MATTNLHQREFVRVCYKCANVPFIVADKEKMHLFASGADAYE